MMDKHSIYFYSNSFVMTITCYQSPFHSHCSATVNDLKGSKSGKVLNGRSKEQSIVWKQRPSSKTLLEVHRCQEAENPPEIRWILRTSKTVGWNSNRLWSICTRSEPTLEGEYHLLLTLIARANANVAWRRFIYWRKKEKRMCDGV